MTFRFKRVKLNRLTLKRIGASMIWILVLISFMFCGDGYNRLAMDFMKGREGKMFVVLDPIITTVSNENADGGWATISISNMSVLKYMGYDKTNSPIYRHYKFSDEYGRTIYLDQYNVYESIGYEDYQEGDDGTKN